MRTAILLLPIVSLLIGACVPAAKLQKEQADEAAYNAQVQNVNKANRCSQVAVPGTTAHLECSMGLPQTNNEIPLAK